MTDQGGEALDHVDRRVVRETLEEIRQTPVPAERGRYGCLAAVMGLVVLVAWPRVVDLVPGGEFVSPFVWLAGIVLVLGGPAMALLGSGGGGREAAAAVEAALRRLEDPASDRETLLRAATLLVAHAYTARGPTTVQTFDTEEVAPRIGGRLPLVLAVERRLVEEDAAYPVFSLEAGEG